MGQDAFSMPFAKSNDLNSIPTATGGIARLAFARLEEMGKNPTVVLSKAGLTSEAARDPAIRLEVQTQIKLLELAAEEAQDEWLGFHMACNYDLHEIGLCLLCDRVVASAFRRASKRRAV
ncbi:AraC family transcriptional regulator [Bradyrhizobium japonicum]|uniref:AraC family transcriptional regulator n=1 Tax=Bradyrhizobium japonicum TaxID=375 RepID=A0A1L3FB44_BRAJP|nr:AraC family transcriptional regulator ligand-binding domain-containing protein [Bradyrhizobium japonicum]APG10462.1 AraC family transcriptional regulator [Bradyrhizobium japonicum]